ncbi:TonB-dependent receptor [Dokdonia sp.]|uniref:SusC/RagA family TonB-linked outer membrane protein n=1 Tax=Dokdonia sp. TaxID=2024995 RepID=UPI003265E5E5
MNVKTKFSLVFFFLFGAMLFAQNSYELTGNVTSGTDGIAIPGVNVIIESTQTGTTTDFEGNYQITVSTGDILQFSYVGFATQTITITGQPTLNVVLAIDNTLDEVVVVGYGTRKKSHLTGAIAKVGGEEVAAIQANRVDDALAGKLAGVLIKNQNGEPGAAPTILIRGSASVNGNSSPLIVVDGYPISGDLGTINPNDIQSIEVLKDGASAAIYGSRGANGVVLVTTKKGKQGKTSFSYNTYFSTSNKYERDNLLMNAGEWANTIESNIANGSWDVSEVDPALLDYRINAFRNSPGAISPEEWLFQTGNTISNNFSMTGGNEDVRYFASLGHLDTEGVAITQEFERYNVRLSIDAKLGEKFKTGMSFNGFYSDRALLAHDQRDLLRAYGVHPIFHTEESIAFVQQLNNEAVALGLAPFDDGYRGGDAPFNNSIFTLQPGDTAQDWHYGRSGNGIGGSGDAGPATKLNNQERTQRTYFGNFNSYLQYSIIDGLNIRTVLGADLEDTQQYRYRGLEADSRARSTQTNLNQTDLKRSSVLSETTLNYAKVFGKHDLAAVVGLEFQNFYRRGIAVNGTNVPFGEIINFNLLDPADITTTERDETITRRSVFGRINYAYDDRFLLSVSVRRDGDSRFGENNRYETFPALSFGWNIHNESWYSSDLLNLLKLRFSTGSLGSTSDLGAYNSLSLLNPQATIFGTGFLIPSDIANPDLTWQTTTERNYGSDLGFLNNRIRVGVDYYTSDIEDILINQSVSEVFGTPSIRLNAGDVRSSGFELELSANVIQKQDFTLTVGGNLSTVNTEITALNDGSLELPRQIYGQSGRGPIFRNYVGGEIGEMWGLESEGLVESIHIADPTRTLGADSGEVYVVDQNGDGVIDATRTVEEGGDLVKIGQNTPDFYWGFNTSMKYKDFDLSMQWQGSHGAEVFNVDPLYWQSQFGGRLRDSFDANDDGIADASGRHYTRARDQTSSAIQDASYVALRNLTIGYEFDQGLTGKVGLTSARLYLAATNLLYFWSSEYTSFNPEGIETTNSGYAGPVTNGVQVGASPIVRSFSLGLNVNF